MNRYLKKVKSKLDQVLKCHQEVIHKKKFLALPKHKT